MSAGTPDEQEPRCSFCELGPNEVRKLIAGPKASICDTCVALCVDILTADPARQGAVSPATTTARPQHPRWHAESRCLICRMPVVLGDSVVLEERGPLCLACVSEVEAAAAELPRPEGSAGET